MEVHIVVGLVYVQYRVSRVNSLLNQERQAVVCLRIRGIELVENKLENHQGIDHGH